MKYALIALLLAVSVGCVALVAASLEEEPWKWHDARQSKARADAGSER